jgi:hypothetical protein
LVVGRQLAQRRLFVLESLKGGPRGGADAILDSKRETTADTSRAAQSGAALKPGRARTSPRATTPPLEEPSPSGPRSLGRSLLVFLSVLAVLAVIAASIWPEETKDLFLRVTSLAGWRTLGSDPAAEE